MNIDKNIEHLLKHRLLIHIGFWGIMLTFTLLGETNGEHAKVTPEEFIHLFVHFVGFIGATYFNLYYLIPRYLISRKYFAYSSGIILTSAISTIATQYLQVIIGKFILNIEVDEDFVFLFFHLSFYCFFIMMLTTMFYFLRRRMTMQEMGIKLREAEKQQIASELKVLKTQLNPHFFFNTLNSIYSLSIDNNPKTPDVVLKLSELMRYVLYDTSQERTVLKKEIEFIRNYIELEETRFEDSIAVQFNIIGNNYENWTIAPLLFISIIENAFKHCNKTETPAEITIEIDVSQLPMFAVMVSNSASSTNSTYTKHKGVGIENTKQRLQLLYPNKHTLEISHDENNFEVYLQLDLSNQ